ncbi:glycerol-3-phosphate dehydrogenase, NAD(P)-dependent [Syntrophotalea carbinolica DSM 2380]|uniref:Glycerol-3-phosphate dehydrogenase [NAD(P)+] n=1 Tax=Syntrophotalea carbinolica (strain DSM 2380 / NBRC 103641 / GraBd1) TaxID=338963 RepID=GPDA_SYNC1|nr:NAD(P)H-dependent glycerol-3-phosphate dehydrogenase [Syntrophotalea carbinolica]Q3A8M2.1 RecName: Full=Glycerol-3-phosphate dehydrogenase [NAD(P)+]; AltName: Full=NAD(P)H-dependent glycerol-3-phosphate dehydrogenase [Syntrophotalea carbinolica DSM 2380]ABA87270.1 glycerol-3-phosphate dehydrogenase, NAD(P)-dependent [Syntrophotalea carbinolica DSM 2380]
MNIGVIGAGSWGTTLADLLSKNGHAVTLWAYEQDLVERMRKSAKNDLYLPDFTLHEKLAYSSDLGEVAAGKDMVVLVAPSQVLRAVVRQAEPHLAKDTILVSAAKGIENDTLMPMSEVLKEVLPEERLQRAAYLSGPTFAREVAAEIPTALTVASEDENIARTVQKIFSCEYFRVYRSSDIVGVELGGALKNVIALAAGISDGLGYGYNARAALITRGLAEMTRIGVAMVARERTFMGLSGMGDLVLTCTGDLSRNRSVGLELGRGRKLEDILSGMRMVAEGVKTTLSAYQLAKRLGVETPIIEQMYLILFENKDPRDAVADLMQRSLKAEMD